MRDDVCIGVLLVGAVQRMNVVESHIEIAMGTSSDRMYRHRAKPTFRQRVKI